MILVPGTGRTRRPILFIVGERPGHEEVRNRPPMPFVGAAGQELWSRLARICDVDRADCFTTNLVKTYSKDPPTADEITRDRPILAGELAKVRPTLIVTVGYHAARFFLPHFHGVTGEFFHGLTFQVRIGRLDPYTALLVPVVHSAAALRQPAIYQNQLTNDLRQVRRVLDGDTRPFRPRLPPAYRVGLATTIAAVRGGGGVRGGVLGLDTEGSLVRPWSAECVTVSSEDDTASILETHTPACDLLYLQSAIDSADRIAIHHAKHDLKVAHTLGLAIPDAKVDDTMVMAYILGLPQGLKELSYRIRGWTMGSYTDLIQPLDDGLVRQQLEQTYATQKAADDHRRDVAKREKQSRARSRRLLRPGAPVPGRGPQRRGKHGLTTSRPRAAEKAAPDPQGRDAQAADEKGPIADFPRRALTSIRGILDKPADKTLRERWTGSTFYPYSPLPPEPTWKDAPRDLRIPYALTDAIAHRTMREVLARKIARLGLDRVYHHDMAVLPFLVRSEEVGIAVDARELHRLSKVFTREREAILDQIETIAGRRIDPNEHEKVSELLFDDLGIRPTRLTKGGKFFTTQDKYLKARRAEHAIVPLVLDGRQLGKYLGTYTNKLPGLLIEGRYYPNWKYTRTATGRLAEEIILLIPKHSPRATLIRNCFHATDGRTLVSVDLSQIELRVMAHLSRDPRLLDAYDRGEDIHANVAHALLGAPKRKDQQDESLHRLPAKTINFGIINGMTEYGMLDQLHENGQLHWDVEQVREMLQGWFRIHQGVEQYWQGKIREAQATGYVRDELFGRRRQVSSIWSEDPRIVAEGERQCLFAIQSAADTISKIWNARIWKRIIRPAHASGWYCEPWCRVHDDTILEVANRRAADVRSRMLELVPDLLAIPTLAEGKSGDRWGSLHEG